MNYRILPLLCAALCCITLHTVAQTPEKDTSPERLYREGKTWFQQKAYTAAIAPLQTYLRQTAAENAPLPQAQQRQEAAYMLACTSYELKDEQCLEKLQAFLGEYPDTPHANRIDPLMASVQYSEGN